MAFKLKSGNKPAFKLVGSSPDIKEGLDRKYGLGEYSRDGSKFNQRMLSGESKYQYNVRMQKARNKASRSAGEQKSKSSMPDPKTEIKGLQGQQPLWAQRDPLGINKNPNDLRAQGRSSTSYLPSAPGDKWTYSFEQNDDGIPELMAFDPDGNFHSIEPGSKSDKAIRQRYTGSETGDLSSWYGHDTHGEEYSYTKDPETDDMMGADFHHWNYFEKKNYLPYDLAQKKYNPNYKGSKK